MNFDHFLIAAAAVLSVTYLSTLSDTSRRRLIEVPVGAPELPPALDADEPGRDASLLVEVVDEHEALVADAVVSVFPIRDGQAFSGGVKLSSQDGQASFDRLPRGEVWVLSQGPGRQRASTRLVLGGERAQARLTLRKAHRLQIRAVDENDRPVVGASVEVRGGDPLPFLGKNGDNGLVEFDRLGPGPWSVRVTAPGYEAITRSGVQPGSQRLVLRSLGSIEVVVLGLDGSPAADATIEVAGSGLWPARRAKTGEDGRVKIAGIPAGAYDVAASLGELISPTSIGTPVRRGEPSQVRLQLGQGKKVAVRVLDGEGDEAQPVARAEVVLADEGISSFPRQALTDERGEAQLGPVGVKGATLGVRAEGFVPRTGVRIAAEQRETITVALMRGGKLVGDVVDTHGNPIDGASIEVVGVDFSGMPVDETPERMSFRASHFAWALAAPSLLIPAGELGVMPGPLPPIPHGNQILPAAYRPAAAGPPLPVAPWVSGAEGAFRLGPVPPGRLRALVRHPGYVEGSSDAVTVAPGGEARVKVVLRAGGTLEGRVLDHSDRPVPGARVEIAAVHGSAVRSAITADDGTFGFAAVPGEVSVSITRPGAFEDVALRKSVTVGEGERKEVSFTLPEAREPIEVRVVDQRGSPLDNAQVTALSLSPTSPLRTTRFTRGDGVALIPSAAGLPLRLEVSLVGHAPRAEMLDKAEREVRVQLGKAAAIEGEVTTRGGRIALEGATVTVRVGHITRSERADAEGHYLLRDLPPGPARLTFSAKGYARVERSLTLVEPDRDRPTTLDRVDLAEAGEVEGEVVDKNGDPVAGARVALGTVPAFLPVGPLPPGVAVTDARGRFKLGDLPEGEIEIEAFAPDRGRGRERSIKVMAGRKLRGVRVSLDTEIAQGETAAAGGVAVTLSEDDEHHILLKAVAPRSEAERAGLASGDILVAIDDHEPTTLEEARRWLSGPLGEDVVLRVIRHGEIHRFRVARERVRR